MEVPHEGGVLSQAIQNSKDEWRREDLPLIFWVYVLSKAFIAISKLWEIVLQSIARNMLLEID